MTRADSTLPATDRGGGIAPVQGPDEDVVGRLLGRFSVLPALLVLPFLLTSFPLLFLGWFKPVPVIVLWLLLAAVIVPAGWRRIPSVSRTSVFGVGREDAGRVVGEPAGIRTPRWTFITLVVIAVAFGIDQVKYHSQFVIVLLDPASYMEFAYWISVHGSLPIPQNAQAFGGASGITYGSAAFYQVGHVIVPQFMAGLPMLLSLGFWAGGAKLAVFWGPLLGAAAVFTFGGLAARLIGPRWAPLAALTLAICIPQQYTSRATFSEPLAQILFLGGLSLWIDTQRTDRGAADAGPWRGNVRGHARSATHVLAGITGLLLGITLLVRLDGPSDILLAVPYCGLLILDRRRQAVPLIAGLIVGLLYGTVDGLVLSRPYLRTNISSVVPMTEAFILATLVTVAAVWWLRRRGQSLPVAPRWLVTAATVLPFVVLVGFTVRPYVERNWSALQYAPLALHWVYWYVGGPVILLGTIGAALLSRRCVRGQAPEWVLPFLVFGWTITEFLYRPAITPYQPWASRRMVPAVIPGLILFSVWLAAWCTSKSRSVRLTRVPRYLERFPRTCVIACCALAIFVPPAVDTFGLGVSDTSQGLRLVANGLAFKNSNVGEIQAIEQICAAIPANASVLIIDVTMDTEFAQDIRGMCDVPTAGVVHSTDADINSGIRGIERAGRIPFVIASTPDKLSHLGNGRVKRIMTLDTSIDEHLRFGTPTSPTAQVFTAYSWEPGK